MSKAIYYIINILIINLSLAQESSVHPQNILNAESIEKLKSGRLLVRLESRENKIEFLQKQLNATNCDASCRKRIGDELNNEITDRDSFNLNFIKAFRKYFIFCPVYFYYDKDHQSLLQSNWHGKYYLDDQLQLTDLAFHHDSLMILKKEFTPNSENEGWLFQTVNGITLKNGFPYINENNFKTFLTRITYADHDRKNCEYLVRKLNKNLFRYYTDAAIRKVEEQNNFH